MVSRWRIVLALAVVTVIGLAAKNYTGPAHGWINDYGPASAAYVVFFMLVAYFVFPRPSAATRIAVVVLLATCILEVLQLWRPAWLQALRSSTLGAALLGTTFSPWDFPAYVVGSILGWSLLRWLSPGPTLQEQ
jgi:hypothetical protein